MKHVIALTRYDSLGASSRVRLLQYLPLLKSAGFDICVHPLFSDAYVHSLYTSGRRPSSKVLWGYLKRIGRLIFNRSTPVWIEKELLPQCPGLLELLLLGQRNFVVDFDDPIFLNYHDKSLKFSKLLSRARHVSVGSESLAEWARSQSSRNITHIPSAVDTNRLTPHSGYRQEGPVRLGWIGSPASAHFLSPMGPILRELSRKYPLEFHCIGATVNFEGVRCILHPWSVDTEKELMSILDIGIMPLDSSPWARGKCAYKILQYMATGIACVASDIGENSKVIRHELTGFLASGYEDWVHYISYLIENPDPRNQIGKNAREESVEKYSLSHCGEKMILLFNELVTK